jgi:hypothetical protein
MRFSKKTQDTAEPLIAAAVAEGAPVEVTTPLPEPAPEPVAVVTVGHGQCRSCGCKRATYRDGTRWRCKTCDRPVAGS